MLEVPLETLLLSRPLGVKGLVGKTVESAETSNKGKLLHPGWGVPAGPPLSGTPSWAADSDSGWDTQGRALQWRMPVAKEASKGGGQMGLQ